MMNKRSQLKNYYWIYILIFATIGVLLATTMTAESFDSEDNRRIGFEYLNLSGNVTPYAQAEVVHLWNTKDDYFFNISSGIQFTNHFEEYWTHNIFCGGRWSGSEWLDFCQDEIPFTWTLGSDNSSYVFLYGYYDINYAGKSIRYDINYSLEINDTEIQIDMGAQSGKKAIPEPLRFIWKINDIKIDSIYGNNSYLVNNIWYDATNLTNPSYDINDSKKVSLTNLSDSNFFARQDISQEYLNLRWDNNTDSVFEMYNDSEEYNSPVALYINLPNGLAPDSNYETTMYWIDATYDNKAESAESAADPRTLNIDLGDNANLLVLSITTKGSDRGGGAPTYDSNTMTQAGTRLDGGEVVAELWYLLDPPTTGSLEISVPNPNTNEVNIIASSYVSSTGAFVFDNTNEASAVSTNPTVSLDVADSASVVVDSMGSGYKDVIDANAHELLYSRDTGNEGYAAQYVLGQSGSVAMSYTQDSDDWAIVAASFIEYADTEAPNYSDNKTNVTEPFINEYVNMSVIWTDVGTSGINYTWIGNNFTGSWINDTFVAQNSDSPVTSYNVTQVTKSGSICWQGYANDSKGYFNQTEIYCINGYNYGNLVVNLTLPNNSSSEYAQNDTFTINATVTCEGANAKCGTVYGTAMYNTSTGLQNISTTEGETPLYIVGGGSGSDSIGFWRPVNWTVGIDEGDGSSNYVSNPENVTDYRYNDTNTYTYLYSDSSGGSADRAKINYTFNISNSVSKWTIFYNSSFTDLTGTDSVYYVLLYDFLTTTFDSIEVFTTPFAYTSRTISNSDEYISNNGEIIIQFRIWNTGSNVAEVNITDLHITSENTKTYDYWNDTGKVGGSGNSNFSNYAGASDCIIEWCDGGSEPVSNTYQRLNQSDDSTATDDDTGATYQYQSFNFKIDEDENDISDIIFTLEGYYAISEKNISIWNDTSSSWFNVTRTPIADDDIGVIIYYNNSNSINDIISNSGYTHIRVEGVSGGGTISVDYVKVNVISSAGAQNLQSTTLDDGDSWNVSWTVNATGAQDTYHNITVKFNSSHIGNVATNYTQNKTVVINPLGPGNLVVNLTLPNNSSSEYVQNTTFTINATVTCEGTDVKCGTVYATALYNTSNVWENISTSVGATPLRIISGVNSKSNGFWRPVNWTQLLTTPIADLSDAVDKRYNDTTTAVYGRFQSATDHINYTFNISTSISSFNYFIRKYTGSGYCVNSSFYNFDNSVFDIVSPNDCEGSPAWRVSNGTLGSAYIGPTGNVILKLNGSQGGPENLISDTYIHTENTKTYDYRKDSGTVGGNSGNNATAEADVSPTCNDPPWCTNINDGLNYGSINSSDDTYVTVGGGGGQAGAFNFHFIIEDSIEDMGAIAIQMEAYPSETPMTLYIWNSTEYENISRYSQTADDDIGMYAILYENLADYIDSDNYLHLYLNWSSGTSPQGSVDYVKVNVISEDNLNRQWTTLNEGESWNVSWLVNATGDKDSYHNITVKFNSSVTDVIANFTQNKTIVIEPTTTDETAPEVTLLYPADNSYNDTSSDITFNCSVTDGGTIKNVSLWGNWSHTIWSDDFSSYMEYTNANESYLIENYYTTPNQTIVNEAYRMDGVTAGDEPISIIRNDSFGNNFAYTDYEVFVDAMATTSYGGAYICPRYNTVNNKFEVVLDFQFDQMIFSVVDGGVWKNLAIKSLNGVVEPNTWYNFGVKVMTNGSSTRFDIYFNDTLQISIHNETLQTNTDLALLAYDFDDPFDIWFDNLTVTSNAWHENYTTTELTGGHMETTVNLTNGTFSNSTYAWNCYACDVDNNCNFSAANYTFLSNYTYTEAADTCTYTPGQDWEVNCADNCDISSTVFLEDYDLTLYGTGSFIINADILVDRFVKPIGTCDVINTINDGNALIIKVG